MGELRYIMLFVSDLERSVRFYRETLGLTLHSEAREQAEFAVGGTTLSLHQAHTDAPHHHAPTTVGTVRLGILVDHLDAVHARLVQAGVRCLAPPERREGVQMALYEDPDGFHLSLASHAG